MVCETRKWNVSFIMKLTLKSTHTRISFVPVFHSSCANNTALSLRGCIQRHHMYFWIHAQWHNVHSIYHEQCTVVAAWKQTTASTSSKRSADQKVANFAKLVFCFRAWTVNHSVPRVYLLQLHGTHCHYKSSRLCIALISDFVYLPDPLYSAHVLCVC